MQTLLIAYRNLLQHGKRTALLGSAIAGVAMLLLLLLGLSNGTRETMLRSATTLSTGHVNIGGFYKVTAGQSAPVVTKYKDLVEHVRKNVPELDFVVTRGRGWAKAVSQGGSQQVGIAGVDIDAERDLRKVLVITSGSVDALRTPGNVMLFEEQAKKLEVKVGDLITVSAPTLRGTNNTLDLTVGAIAQDVGLLSKFNVFVPAQSLRQLYRLNEDSTGAIQLYLKDVKDVVAVQERLRKTLAEAGYGVMDNDPRAFFQKFEVVNREDWTGQKVDLTTWEDEISFTRWTLTALDALTFLLTLALLVVVGIGIMNTMAIAIRERTREIGTLRAMGMQRGQVMRMFLAEAVLLGLFGAVAGAVLGVVVSTTLNALNIRVPIAVQLFLMSDTLHVAIQGSAMAFTIAFITGCISLISLVPSWMAARLKPVTAMQHAG
jgi:putative ABC transport system permease protein